MVWWGGGVDLSDDVVEALGERAGLWVRGVLLADLGGRADAADAVGLELLRRVLEGEVEVRHAGDAASLIRASSEMARGLRGDARELARGAIEAVESGESGELVRERLRAIEAEVRERRERGGV